MRLIAISLMVLLVASSLPFALGETPWLEDYSYRKLITVAGSTGAGTGYVVFVKAYYTSGTDGLEQLTGGHNGVNASKVYLAGHVEADFDDVRFTGTDGETELSYFRDSYTTSTSALFAVEVTENLNTTQSFYIYFGDAGQASESSAANTFRRVISSGIVLSLPMNEAAGNCIDYSGNGNTGTVTGATRVATGQFGTGLNFDGNDNVATTDALTLTTTLSTVAYIKMPAQTINEYPYIVGQTKSDNSDAQWALNIRSNGGDTWALAAGAWATISGAFDNAFHTIGMTHNDASSNIGYLDGLAVDTQVAAANAASTRVCYLMYNENRAEYAEGVLSGVFVFNEVLAPDVMVDLDNYYPQCSSANLGSLYLRSFVNPEPQPSSVGSLETNNRYASTNYVWMAVLLVIGFVFMGFMLLRRGD